MALIAVAAALVVCGLVVLVVGPVKLFGLTAGELYSSVVDGTGAGASFEGTTCRHAGPRLWRCDVSDRGSSSVVTYRVTVKSDGCWKASRISDGGEGPLPKRASACIGLDDLVHL